MPPARDSRGRFVKGSGAAGGADGGTTVKWYGKDVERRLIDEATKRLARAAEALKREIQKNISTSAQKGADRSKPGGYPHRETSRLHNSIFTDVDAIGGVAMVGTNVKYAKHLELGTKRMAARPFFRRTMLEQLQQIRAIMKGGI